MWWAALALAAPGIQVANTQVGPKIDGHLDEPIWAAAEPLTEFTRYQPTQGGEPVGTTEVRFVQTANALYIGVKVSGVDYNVRARVSAREAIDADDQIGIYIDPFGDSQDGYIFYINAVGIQQDLQYSAGRWNMSWNTVFQSKGTVTEDGYELEVMLPFESIRYAKDSDTWGLILTRKVPSEGAKYGWPHLVRGHPQVFTQAGELRGVKPPKRAGSFEIIPGIAGRMGFDQGGVRQPENWYDAVHPFIDMRASLSANSTLLMTVFPDFSDVEPDTMPIRLNQRFSALFTERRPFFTESSGNLTDPAASLYTRRIQAPLYGLKAIGKESGWTYGVLHTMDLEPIALGHEDDTPGWDEINEDAMSFDTVARLRRDFEGGSWIGGTFTDRHLINDDAWFDAGTLDGRAMLGRRWRMTSWAGFSGTGGDGQQLLGGAGEVAFERPSGDGLGFLASFESTSPGFRQELGRRFQSGTVSGQAQIDWTMPGTGALSTFRPRAFYNEFDEFEGDANREVGGSLQFVINGVHTLETRGSWGETVEGDDRVDRWLALLSWRGQVGAVLDLEPTVSVGDVYDYFRNGKSRQVLSELVATLRPGLGLRLDLLGRYNTLFPIDDPAAERSWSALARGKMSWQFTQAWGLRVIGEYNYLLDPINVEPNLSSFSGSAMVSWRLHAFTAAFLGYSTWLPLEGHVDASTEHQLFARVSIWWRP